MNKIFRLHTNGSDTVQDWQETSAMLDVHIGTIADPAGASAKNPITSIPTPFARIDIAKNAFRQVISGGRADGNSIHHKVVSDCLDVLEIFFNAPLLSDEIEIIAWNPGITMQGGQMTIQPGSDLAALESASDKGHSLLGKTLRMYLEQDAGAYNFASLKQLFLLNYLRGPRELNIIGGTSPATLAFSSANDLSFVAIQLGGRQAFSGAPFALHKRADDFILFVYALRAAMPQFAVYFPEVAEYLREVVFPILPESLKKEIGALKENTYRSRYAPISITGAGAGNHPEILGFELLGVGGVDVSESDFRMEPAKPQPDGFSVPLVLPAYTFTQPLKYVNAPWNPQTKVPFYDAAPQRERRLPGQSQHQYPYVTVSDFLEDYLIRLPFATDKRRFFGGHLEEEHGYVLPVKQALFRYFSTENVQGTLPGTGVRMFELTKGAAGSIDATLRIPIRNGHYIEMKRNYKTSVSPEQPLRPAKEENRGVVAEHAFTLAVYPFLKTGSDERANYRVLMVDADNDEYTRRQQYRLSFWKDDANVTEISPETVQRKEDKQTEYVTTDTYVLDKEFDLISVANSTPASGMLIPLLKPVRPGTSQFTFSVDFGTTNTHIEYSVNGGPAQPFTMAGSDGQLGLLHVDDDANYNKLSQVRRGLAVMLKVHESDFIPDTIEAFGKESVYSFPQRTVIAESRKAGAGESLRALAAQNILFTYERRITSQYQDWITDLKWADGGNDRNKSRITSFIEELVMLMRNKVLLNQGDIDSTRIVWFYPSSMRAFQLGQLETIWSEAIRKIFSPRLRSQKLLESLAPFYYFKNSKQMLTGTTHSVNIDIGGGTTDIVLFRGEDPTDSTSFRFAGNGIFGDGYGSTVQDNGFVRAFEAAKLAGLLHDPNRPLGAFGDIYEDLKSKQKSDDVISYLFTFKRHREFAQLGIDFTKYLQEPGELKLVPLIAFAAIIYHTASWMKERKQDYPLHLSFSGSGSKFLNILDAGSDLPNLGRFVNLIFSSVYATAISNIRLKCVDNPKEVTAKGGLYLKDGDSMGSIAPSVHAGIAPEALKSGTVTYNDLSDPNVQAAAEKNALAFLALFKTWHQSFSYRDHFGADMRRYETYEAMLRNGLKLGIQEGIARLRKEHKPDDAETIRETVFFYPFIPLLNELALHIAQNPA